MRTSYLLSALSGLSLTAAHFQLKTPKSIGTADDTFADAPCGGFTPDLSNGSKQLVDVHVGGEPFALRLSHARCTWLIRATLDAQAKDGWEKAYPITVQSGLGDICFPDVTFPEEWAGKKGVISVVSSADDGELFQCIAANFVNGTADRPTSCSNSSSVSAYPTSDANLDALIGDQKANTSSTAEPSASATADNAASSLLASSTVQGLGSAITIVSMFILGGALMV